MLLALAPCVAASLCFLPACAVHFSCSMPCAVSSIKLFTAPPLARRVCAPALAGGGHRSAANETSERAKAGLSGETAAAAAAAALAVTSAGQVKATAAVAGARMAGGKAVDTAASGHVRRNGRLRTAAGSRSSRPCQHQRAGGQGPASRWDAGPAGVEPVL